MSGTEIRRFSDDHSLKGGRWIVSQLQAISSSLSAGLALPIVVISAYVALLAGSLYQVALVPLLSFGLWSLGALVGERVTRDRNRMLPWAFGASVGRAAAMAAIAYVVYHTDPAVDDRLTLFFVCLGLLGFGAGFTSSPLESLLRKAFESSSRQQIFATRGFWGVIAAALAGLVVRSVFESDGPSTQRAFAYLFAAAAGCLASSAFFTLLIKEPSRRLSGARHPHALSTFGTYGDHIMRRYLIFRIVLAAVAMVDVFIVVYAIRELSLDLTFLGTYVIAFCVALAVCLPLARSLGARRGGRAVMQASVWLKLIAPVVLLTIPYLRGSEDVADRLSGDSLYFWMLAGCFVALGASLAFQTAGNFQYLGEIAPAIHRDGYFTATNLVMMFTALFPMLGAWIVVGWDYQRLFAVTAAVALLAVLLSGILVDNRVVASVSIAKPRVSRAPVR